MTLWVVVTAAAAVLATIALFVSGLIYPYSAVDRIIRTYEANLVQAREDTSYYRAAAQSCAAAVAHREGQVRTLQELLAQCQGAG